MSYPPYFVSHPEYDRHTTVHELHEMIRDTPSSSVARELEVLEETDYHTFRLLAAFFRRAERRIAEKGLQEIYDHEEEEY